MSSQRRQDRQRARQRMLDAHHVAGAPGAGGQIARSAWRRSADASHPPARAGTLASSGRRCEHVQGLLVTSCHSGPSNCDGGPTSSAGCTARALQHHVPHRLLRRDRGRCAPGGSRPSRRSPAPSSPRPAGGSAARSGCAGDTLLIEQRQQQRLPARQEHGAVIELDAQHVRGRRGAGERHEVVADLAGAGAEVVLGAEAGEVATDHLQLLRVVEATRALARPDPAVRRVDDARMIRGGVHRRVPRARAGAGVRRNPSEDRPADVPLAIADHEVLVRNAHLRRQAPGPAPPSVACSSSMRFMLVAAGSCASQAPNQQACGCLIVAHQQAGRAALHQFHRGRGAMHPDLLAHHLKRHVARRGGEVVLADPGAVDALDIEPVAVAVGEAPGDVPVGAGHQQRRPGQRHAVQIQRGRRIAADVQARLVPDGRHALPEVHVVGDQRGAGRGQAPGHRPAVAAHARRAPDAVLRPRRCRGGAAHVQDARHAGIGSVGRRWLRASDTSAAHPSWCRAG